MSKCGYTIALLSAFMVALTGIAIADTMDKLIAWAQNAPPMAARSGEYPTVKTSVVDRLGTSPDTAKNSEWGLGAHGIHLLTAGAGSAWVYDYAHRIAAETDYGEFAKSAIFYASPPPSKIPSQDLSAVTSLRGLRLGMTVQAAARDLDVAASSASAVQVEGRPLPHFTALSVSKACPKPQMCAHVTDVIFQDDRAVYIETGTAGP